MVTEFTVTISLAVWLTFDQLFCIFENIGGMMPPISTSQNCVIDFVDKIEQVGGGRGCRKLLVFLACLNGSGTILLFPGELFLWHT